MPADRTLKARLERPNGLVAVVGDEMIELRLTNDPTVIEALSGDGKTWYPVQYADTLFPRCPCQAGIHGSECKHVAAILELAAAQGENTPMAETTQALVPAAATKATSITLVAQERRAQLALARAGFDDALFLAKQAILSGMTPKVRAKGPQGWADRDMTKEEAALIVLQATDLGFTWTQAFAVLVPLDGKPFFMAKGVHAVIERSGKGYIHRGLVTPTEASGYGIRYLPNGTARRVDLKITMDMAIAAGWTHRTTRGDGGSSQKVMKDNWKNTPGPMLWARFVTTIGWSLFPDVLMGMDVVEGDEPERVTQADAESVPSYALKMTDGVAVDDSEKTAATAAATADLNAPPADVTEGEFRDASEPAAPEPTPARPAATRAKRAEPTPEPDAPFQGEPHAPPSDDDLPMGDDLPMESVPTQAMTDEAFLDGVVACLRPLGSNWGQVKVAFGFTGSTAPDIKAELCTWRREFGNDVDPVAYVRDRILSARAAG